MRHVGVTHRRQFTGSVFAGVSMRVGAVGDDFRVLTVQQLRGEFLDLFWWDVQGSSDVGFALTFRSQSLDERYLFLIELGFQVIGRNCAVHPCNLPVRQRGSFG